MRGSVYALRSMSLSRNELKWLSYAVDLAAEANHKQWKVGAVLVHSGRVISIGINKYRNDPSRVGYREVSYHAEEVALRRAGSAIGSTIYVARLTRSGKIGMSRPCSRCQDLLVEHGISTVVWTEPFGWGKQRLNRLVHGEHANLTTATPARTTHPLLGQ